MRFFTTAPRLLSKSAWISIGLIVFGWTAVIFAQPNMVESAPSDSLIFLEFQDHTSKSNETNQLAFGVRTDGSFHISYKTFDRAGKQTSEQETDGQLNPTELEQLKNTIPTISLDPPITNPMNIGYGTDLTRGWQGKLLTLINGTKQTILFTSLRPPTYPERSVALNRLVTFIFDLKNLALLKIGKTRQPAQMQN